MAVRQYIGARYVPRFVGNYDPTQSYEALDVVDNGSGTSYIAKIPTPANTPLTDTDHWFLYGSTSGAIVNLQQQINDMKDGTVPGSLQEQIDTNTSDITALSNKTMGYTTPEFFGAAGDGVTDDTQAVKDAIATGKIVLFGATYLIAGQITAQDINFIGGGKLLLSYTGGYTFVLSGISSMIGLTFEGKGSGVNDGLQIKGRPNISICKFTKFNTAITLCDTYAGRIERCDFSYNTNCALLKNLSWGSSTASTSFTFSDSTFVTSDKGIISVDGENCRNIEIDTCVFEYDYVHGLELYDTIGIVKNCWFEHIDYTDSVAIFGKNCFLTTINNTFIGATVTTKYDLTQPSWSNTDRGYVSIEKSRVATRHLLLTDRYTQSDTGDRIDINGDGGDINVYRGATLLGSLPYTDGSRVKYNCVSANNYQNPPTFNARNTGFTYQKLSTGKYYINFNRSISSVSIFANATPLANTPTNLDSLTTSNCYNVHVFGVNTNSVSNYKDWKQANGCVIMVTNSSGTLTDAHIDVMIVESL